ncbi:hypothetical protein D3C76_1699570 [compost metagenome]
MNGAHQFAGLLGAFHHRHQQGLGADVEDLFDQRGIADHRADDRLRSVGRHRLQLTEQAAQVVGRVFTVDQQPVETGIGRQFCAIRVSQAKPQTNLCLA